MPPLAPRRTLFLGATSTAGPHTSLQPSPSEFIVLNLAFQHCSSPCSNCEACFGNGTQPELITDTAEECQSACSRDTQCAAFQVCMVVQQCSSCVVICESLVPLSGLVLETTSLDPSTISAYSSGISFTCMQHKALFPLPD